jgi:D-beta-D-heptose 7-phosphate kinase/D-beta-D-heptose 1-phosphate adenosyltransferase
MSQQQKQLKVFLLGDSCTDEYHTGIVERLSPEAPVPVIKQVSTTLVPGMAANVNLNLKNLGIHVDFVTNVEKITKSRYIDRRSGQHLLRVDTELDLLGWSGLLPEDMGQYDAVVISDYNKGYLTYEQIEYIIESAKCPVFIDTKKPDLSRFHGAYVKINELEYNNRFSINDKLIVTLGARGAMLKQNNTELVFGTEQVEITDVCGCGDTFLAALTYQYIRTKNINDAIVFANSAASVTVQHRGNYAPTLEEIQ